MSIDVLCFIGWLGQKINLLEDCQNVPVGLEGLTAVTNNWKSQWLSTYNFLLCIPAQWSCRGQAPSILRACPPPRPPGALLVGRDSWRMTYGGLLCFVLFIGCSRLVCPPRAPKSCVQVLTPSTCEWDCVCKQDLAGTMKVLGMKLSWI